MLCASHCSKQGFLLILIRSQIISKYFLILLLHLSFILLSPLRKFLLQNYLKYQSCKFQYHYLLLFVLNSLIAGHYKSNNAFVCFPVRIHIQWKTKYTSLTLYQTFSFFSLSLDRCKLSVYFKGSPTNSLFYLVNIN